MGSQQQFCLRWNNHQSNLLNVFDELLQQETLVDVTLACEGLSMKAHKVVLSACSPYFQHLFADNPCTHPIVILKDVSFTDMRTLVDFMYKGEVNVSHEQLSTLLRVADTLKVKGLAEVTESVTAATAGVTEPEESVPAAPVRTEPAMQYGLSSGGGPVSPPSKRRRRARRLSVGGEDTPDGLGRRSGGPSSRSSTPTELVQHRVFPKTEVIDVSYEDEVMGPERGGGGRASCARMSDGGSNHASAGAGGHPSTSTSSGSGGGGIKRHVGGPSQDDGSLLARISEVPKNFEASSLDADSEMPFTQHLSVVGVESGSPDSGHGLSRLLQQQQQQQRADPGAYYPSTSSLTISEVQGGDGSSMSISDVTGAGPSTAGPSTSRGGGGGSTGGAGGGGVNAQETYRRHMSRAPGGGGTGREANRPLVVRTFYSEVVMDDGDKIKAVCSLCKPIKKIICGQYTVTSNFVKHIKRSHGKEYLELLVTEKRRRTLDGWSGIESLMRTVATVPVIQAAVDEFPLHGQRDLH